jgi:putative ABC transport system permease protein
MIAWLSQVVAVTLLSLRTVPQRLASSSVAVVGVAAVAGVLVAVLSMAVGFRATMMRTGEPDSVMVLRAGADAEMTSIIEGSALKIIPDAPGLARGPRGPIASAELFVIVDLPKRSTGMSAQVPLRGIGTEGFLVRPRLRIVEGRRFETGRNEVIVGRGAAANFANLGVGSVLNLGENRWEVVGIFDGGGTAADSELWCDANVLAPAYRRGNTRQAVYARLESPQALTRFRDALTSDPRLNVKVMRESDYYAEQSVFLFRLITSLGVLVGALMGIGAIFAAVNTMYSAVASRTREIAVLRALGFGGSPVVVSVLTESMLLALLGGIAGGLVAFLGFNGYQAATFNLQSFRAVAFAFAVTPRLVVSAVIYAVVIGFLGGIFPAFRAARLPVVVALREL